MLGISIGNNVHVQRVYLFVARKKKIQDDLAKQKNQGKKDNQSPRA